MVNLPGFESPVIAGKCLGDQHIHVGSANHTSRGAAQDVAAAQNCALAVRLRCGTETEEREMPARSTSPE